MHNGKGLWLHKYWKSNRYRDEQLRLQNLQREREDAEVELARRVRIETTLVRL